MLWPLWVVLIAGSTGSALRAVRPPNSSSRERGWFLIACALRHHRPRYPSDLVSECDGCDLRGSPRQQHCEPRLVLWVLA